MTAVSVASGTSAILNPAQNPLRRAVATIRAEKGPGTRPENSPISEPRMMCRMGTAPAPLVM
jgi:hypothetical protein